MAKTFLPRHGGCKSLLSYQKAEIIYDATVYFVKRFYVKDKACDCGCSQCEEEHSQSRICDACGAILNPVATTGSGARCKSYCDQSAAAAGVWCGKVFRTGICQAACAIAVYNIQQGCYWCCEGDGFYRRCVKPFEDVLSQMGQGCDPMWD